MRFKYLITLLLCFAYTLTQAQQKNLTPEQMWSLKRVSPIGLSEDKNYIIYAVTTPNVKENSFDRKYFKIPFDGGVAMQVTENEVEKITSKVSPDGKWVLFDKKVKISKITAKDHYGDLDKSSGKLYTHLDYRHWDKFLDGDYNHPFIKNIETGQEIDLLEGKPYHCPQEPHGGDEDYIWTPQGNVLYVTKAKVGTQYVNSTNTDIFQYNIQNKSIENLTEGMMGYDTYPSYSPKGVLSWLSMREDGNEADKNDLYILYKGNKINLTKDWDETVDSYFWSEDGKKIYLTAPIDGTVQLFEIKPFSKKIEVKQLTDGYFNINSIVGQKKNKLIVTKTDFNTASEIYSYDLKKKKLTKLTKENDYAYQNIAKCDVEKRYVKTTDGKKMLVWVVFPPQFDKTKKYPALLYCQGGPQSALTPGYSFRWNPALIASQGYVVIAPNRRGMPGHGVEWNAEISMDWGGQPMRDYLSATDDVSKEPYIDKNRLGAVGASYGGYSVFYLAGIHNKRFKSFISHCGIYNFKSMYGTTEEKFFNNHEMGGGYWLDSKEVRKGYEDFNPINFINNWDTPILIIQGGKDYRVSEEQGFQAFTAAQQKGIKSKFLYFPDENHWVLKPQNAIFWQRNFFSWLEETLK